MKTLRRPMFRRGGEVGGGITSGMRSNFQNGTYKQRFDEIMKQYSTPAVDPIAQLLIQGGLRGLSQTGGGGTLGNLAMAFEPAVGQAFKSMESQRAADRSAALTGLEIDMDEKRRREAIEREDRIRKEDKTFDLEKIERKEDFDLDLLGKKQDFEASQSELDRQLKRDTQTVGSGLQKDYSPERIYFETLQKYTDPKAAGYITTIQQEYPEAFAEFAAYIGPSIRKNDNLRGGFIGVLPNQKKGKSREYRFDEMIPGGIYFKPDTKRLYERDSEQNILIEYDPYTGKKLREIPLG